MRFLFGLEIHFGTPKNRLEFRAWTTTLGHRPVKTEPSILSHVYWTQEIVRWYGISYLGRWFFGFWSFGKKSRQDSSELPGYLDANEREEWSRYDQWPEGRG